MKRTPRIGLAMAALGLVLALVGPSAAHAQVSFFGRFPLPHGTLSIGVGSPAYRVGSYVPYGYADQIEYVPDYGYGFRCDSGDWIPVRRYGTRWIVVERPVHEYVRPYRQYDRFYGRDDRYGRYDRRYDRYDHGDVRYDRRYDDRRYDDQQYCDGHDR